MESEGNSIKKIKNSLITLIEAKSLNEIQVKDIVSVSGVSRSTFYRHYNSIYDVVNEIENLFVEHIRNINRDYVPAKLNRNFSQSDQYITETLKFVKSEADVFLAFTGPHGDSTFTSKLQAQVREYFIGKITFHNLHLDYIRFYSEFTSTGHIAAIRFWLTECPNITPEQMSVIIAKLMFGYFFV